MSKNTPTPAEDFFKTAKRKKAPSPTLSDYSSSLLSNDTNEVLADKCMSRSVGSQFKSTLKKEQKSKRKKSSEPKAAHGCSSVAAANLLLSLKDSISSTLVAANEKTKTKKICSSNNDTSVWSSGCHLASQAKPRQVLSRAWFQRFEELKEYRSTHGNCLVPRKYPQNPR